MQLHSCQTLTPETETSTHYFFQQSHRVDVGVGDGAGDSSITDSITDSNFNSLIQAFNEDRDVISAQHHNLGLAGGRPMLPLAMDAALIQFRRVLQSRLERETAGTADAPA